MARLQGKVAIITGAAMGMGEADAMLFAREGAKVVVTDVDTAKLQAVVAAIISEGGSAIGVKLNVTSEQDWAEVLAATLATFGRVDILVNNAGIMSWTSMEDCTLENWNKVQAVNTTGAFLGMKTVIPQMQKQGKGAIVNVSSIAGLTGSTFASGNDMAYCASKWALRGISKFAANVYAADNIRVNSLHPGPTNTPMFQTAEEPAIGWGATFASEIPLPPHMSQPMSQAYAALFLASDEANFITGIELPCDGGFSSH